MEQQQKHYNERGKAREEIVLRAGWCGEYAALIVAQVIAPQKRARPGRLDRAARRALRRKEVAQTLPVSVGRVVVLAPGIARADYPRRAQVEVGASRITLLSIQYSQVVPRRGERGANP